MPTRPFALRPLCAQRPWLIAALLGVLGGCQAESEHDKIFFSCSQEAPQCPESQQCDFQNRCCHPVNASPSTPRGSCRLAPELGTGEALFPTGGKAVSSSAAK